MTDDQSSTRFETKTDLEGESPTLIEGLPGLGLVASIAVNQITTQLALEHHGSIVSEDLPPVAAYDAGRVRDPVRVYAGREPAVMTLQSDVPIPPGAIEPVSECVHSELAAAFERAVFLAGTPAETEEEIGDVIGVATTDETEQAVRDAGIGLAEDSGVIGGVTGALLADCYRYDVPAAILLVRCNPYMPDPQAAHSVIENALEPLVEFDIDTRELLEQAEEIQAQKQQMANQLKQYYQQQDQQQTEIPGMYQ
jgi:uncharacterized protein